MATPRTVSELNKKHAALRIELLALDTRREELLSKMEVLAGAAQILKDERSSSIPFGRTRRWLFRRGELQRFVCSLMRTDGVNQSNRDIALKIIAAKGWDADSYELVNHIRGKVKDVRKRVTANSPR